MTVRYVVAFQPKLAHLEACASRRDTRYFCARPRRYGDNGHLHLHPGCPAKPLPYANPDRYLMVLSKWRGIAIEGSWSYPGCVDFQKRNRTMAALSCLSFQAENRAVGKQTRFAQGNGVMPGVMQALGVPLEMGSWFTGAPADLHSLVISDKVWRQFGAPADIVGKQISLNSVPYVVKGVAKPWFRFQPQYSGDLWFPLDPSSGNLRSRDDHWLICFAKMKPGITEEQARTDMARIAAELGREVAILCVQRLGLLRGRGRRL